MSRPDREEMGGCASSESLGHPATFMNLQLGQKSQESDFTGQKSDHATDSSRASTIVNTTEAPKVRSMLDLARKSSIFGVTAYRKQVANITDVGEFVEGQYYTEVPSSFMSVIKGRSNYAPITRTVFVEADICCKGYLEKKGSWIGNWKKRYFILRRDIRTLCYFQSSDNLVLLGHSLTHSLIHSLTHSLTQDLYQSSLRQLSTSLKVIQVVDRVNFYFLLRPITVKVDSLTMATHLTAS